MKKILQIGHVIVFLFLLFAAAEAAEPAENRKLGYFDDTRTVLLLDAGGKSDEGAYAARYIRQEMEHIFRYPYYRCLDDETYKGKNILPAQLEEVQTESGADIVVLPVITEWSQRIYYPFLTVFDVDPIVETRAVIDVYSLENGETVRQDRVSYFEREEEGFVRDAYIMDELMNRLWTIFPYRRVPLDINSRVSEERREMNKPVGEMGKEKEKLEK